MFRELREHGPGITVEFASGAGIEAGKTQLVHKGVTVGLVKQVQLKKSLDGVLVKIELEPNAAPLACEGSKFWLVQPEIGFSGVKGLDTLLSGARLSVRPGHGTRRTTFKGLDRPPPEEAGPAGRKFIVRSDKLGSLNPGAPVYYREVKVGVVAEHRLADDATAVLITLEIHAPYHLLVRPQSRFWNAGGMAMKIGLLGAQLRSTSLESLLAGGVAFATPEEAAAAAPAPEGTEFTLADDEEKSWLKWQPKIALPAPET